MGRYAAKFRRERGTASPDARTQANPANAECSRAGETGIRSVAMAQPFDPYAAPVADPSMPATGAAADPSWWMAGEVLGLAWERFKRSWFVLVAGYVAVTVFTQLLARGPALLLSAGAQGAGQAPMFALVVLLGTVASLGISTFFMVGMFRMWLEVARGGTPSFGMIFLGGDRFLPMLGLYMVMIPAFVIAFMLFFVPGVIVALGLSLAPFYVIDANMGPIEAMGASWAATKGHKGKLFGFGLLSMGVMILGGLALLVGVFAAIPVVYVAWAIVYTRLSGRGVALPAPGTRS
jgi:hypothetical protein